MGCPDITGFVTPVSSINEMTRQGINFENCGILAMNRFLFIATWRFGLQQIYNNQAVFLTAIHKKTSGWENNRRVLAVRG